jgi:hypothetical protein
VQMASGNARAVMILQWTVICHPTHTSETHNSHTTFEQLKQTHQLNTDQPFIINFKPTSSSEQPTHTSNTPADPQKFPLDSWHCMGGKRERALHIYLYPPRPPASAESVGERQRCGATSDATTSHSSTADCCCTAPLGSHVRACHDRSFGRHSVAIVRNGDEMGGVDRSLRRPRVR